LPLDPLLRDSTVFRMRHNPRYEREAMNTYVQSPHRKNKNKKEKKSGIVALSHPGCLSIFSTKSIKYVIVKTKPHVELWGKVEVCLIVKISIVVGNTKIADEYFIHSSHLGARLINQLLDGIEDSQNDGVVSRLNANDLHHQRR